MAGPLPPLPALRALATVAREGSFVRAASLLGVSTSAVSHQIRALEEMLGAALIERRGKGGARGRSLPTPVGAALAAAVEEALLRISEACDAARDGGRAMRSSLTISASGSVASLWLAPRLAAFAVRPSGATWRVRAIEDEAPDLDAEGIDLAVLRARPDRVLPSDRVLFRDTIFPVCSPTLLAGAEPGRLPSASLLEEEHGPDSEKSWRHWLRLLGEAGSRRRIVRFGGFNQVVAAAVAGAGLALGRMPLIADELRAGRLVRVLPATELPGSWMFVLRARPGRRRHPEAARLAEFLVAAAGDPAPLRQPDR